MVYKVFTVYVFINVSVRFFYRDSFYTTRKPCKISKISIMWCTWVIVSPVNLFCLLCILCLNNILINSLYSTPNPEPDRDGASNSILFNLPKFWESVASIALLKTWQTVHLTKWIWKILHKNCRTLGFRGGVILWIFLLMLGTHLITLKYGPRREKTCLRGFRQSQFQTSILGYRY